MIPSGGRPTLVIGHPGHELRVFGWLEMAQPFVYILTDGSGRDGHSRLASTTRLLDKVGATRGSFYGRLSDRAAYEAILGHNFKLFVDFAQELAQHLIDRKIDYVAGDALEGYNPTHDVCRLVIDAAVGIANRNTDIKVRNFDFPLNGSPTSCDATLADEAIKLQLDDSAFARKVTAVREYSELANEVEKALSENELDAFRQEWLRPVHNSERRNSFTETPPFYERYGERQVAAGHYGEVIRYTEHLLPLADALGRQVELGL